MVSVNDSEIYVVELSGDNENDDLPVDDASSDDDVPLTKYRKTAHIHTALANDGLLQNAGYICSKCIHHQQLKPISEKGVQSEFHETTG